MKREKNNDTQIYDRKWLDNLLKKQQSAVVNFPSSLNKGVATALRYTATDIARAEASFFVSPSKEWHTKTAALNGSNLTLATMLLMDAGLMPRQLDRFKPDLTNIYQELLNTGIIGEECVEAFKESDCYNPDTQMREPLGLWAQRLQKQEPSTVVMTVCPDYSHENGVYNFKSLGNQVGLVAARALRAAINMYAMQQKTGALFRIVVAIADFEGNSEDACRPLGITPQIFTQRCAESQQAFRAAIQKQAPGIEHVLDTPLWSELVPAQDWKHAVDAARDQVAQGNYSGAFKLGDGDLQKMAGMRQKMYARWHGENCDPVKIILRQAPEYGAVGYLVAKTFPNPLIIGADHVAMSPFLHMLNDRIVPTMYMKKVDY